MPKKEKKPKKEYDYDKEDAELDFWGFDKEDKKLIHLQNRIMGLLFEAEGEPFTHAQITKKLEHYDSEEVLERLRFLAKHNLVHAKDIELEGYGKIGIYWEKHWQDC